MNAKTAPNWFYQNATVKDAAGQWTVLYFMTREASDDIISVFVQGRHSGERAVIKAKDFLKRFKPLQDEEELAPMTKHVKKDREKISLL